MLPLALKYVVHNAAGVWRASKRSLSGLTLRSSLKIHQRNSGLEYPRIVDHCRFFTVSSVFRQNEVKAKKLLDALTPEFCQDLADNKTSKKFKLKSIQEELERLYLKEFPLPEALTVEQWNILMEFNSPDLRIFYLVY
jgi:hypothetical protein